MAVGPRMRKFPWPGRPDAGLTLIEMIASLVLVSILVAIAGAGLVNLSESFLFARATADTTQKAQLAMARMTKEFEHLTDTTSGSATQIAFEAFHPDAPLDDLRRFTLSWGGTPGAPLHLTSILPSGSVTDILVDQVVRFELRYIYYDAAGHHTVAASRTAEWAAAAADPARQAALGLRLKLVSDRMDELSTVVFLGKHD